MRFAQAIFAGAALIAAALAIEINEFPASVTAGEQVEIKYSPDNGPTTILLRQGDSDDLTTVATLTESATGGTFTWTVPEGIANGENYALQISQGGETNYWGPFPISGGQDSVSSSSSASASASATSSSASTASDESTTTFVSTSASVTPSASAGGNSTISSATLSTARSTTGGSRPSGSPTSTGGVPQDTGAASTLGSSPLALIFGAVAAMAYLN